MPERPAPGALSARLLAVAAAVPTGARVADVGTDDAALPRRLLATGWTGFCIASDRSRAGLERAAREAADEIETGRLELRRAAGLDALSPGDRIDVVVLSGLGARTILAILDPDRLARLGVRRLVLQPQTETRRVREHLRDLGFGIVDERMTRDRGRFYVVIVAEADPAAAGRWHRGDDEDELLEAGPRLVERRDPIVRSYWWQELERQRRILARSTGASRLRAVRRRKLAVRILARLQPDRGFGVTSV